MALSEIRAEVVEVGVGLPTVLLVEDLAAGREAIAIRRSGRRKAAGNQHLARSEQHGTVKRSACDHLFRESPLLLQRVV